MPIGVVIPAAGIPAENSGFPPLRSVGTLSIIRRIVATFQQVGADRIVVITGYLADELEHHLAHSGVIFLRNERYAETGMIDSVRLGVQLLMDSCDRIFIAPADTPLFTVQTLRLMLEAPGEVVVPSYGGLTGHPVLLNDDAPKELYTSSATSFNRWLTGLAICEVPTDDAGILCHLGTPGSPGMNIAMNRILAAHSRQMVRPLVNVSLCQENVFLDERLALLLSLIDETGSVRTAGQRCQLSYTSCWNCIKSAEEELGYALVLRYQGGAGGSSSTLTARARALVEAYTHYTAAVRRESERLFYEYFTPFINKKIK